MVERVAERPRRQQQAEAAELHEQRDEQPRQRAVRRHEQHEAGERELAQQLEDVGERQRVPTVLRRTTHARGRHAGHQRRVAAAARAHRERCGADGGGGVPSRR